MSVWMYVCVCMYVYICICICIYFTKPAAWEEGRRQLKEYRESRRLFRFRV